MEAKTELNADNKAAISKIDLQRARFMLVSTRMAVRGSAVRDVYDGLYLWGQVTLVIRLVVEGDNRNRKRLIFRQIT